MPARIPFRSAAVRPRPAQTSLRRRAIWAAAAAFLLAGAAGPAMAQTWDRFRGPNGAGVSAETFPAQINERDIAWRTDLPGVGHSSPSVFGRRAFLLSADPETAERMILAVDLDTGLLAWKKSYASATHHLHARSSYASCSPAVDDQHVYVAWSEPEKTTLLALSHDGQEVWSRDFGRWISQHGFGTSPMVYRNLVILHNSQQAEQLPPGVAPGRSELTAVDSASGKTVWSTPLQAVRTCYSVPCVARDAEGKEVLVCASQAEGVFAVDPRNGEILWKTPDAFTMRVVSSPVLAGDLAFGTCGSGGGGNYVVAVRTGPQPTIAYTFKQQAPYVPTPVVKDGLLFLWSDKGVVSCLDAETGNRHWQERVPGAYSGSPVIAGERLYCISEEGELVVLSAAREFELLGRSPLGAPSRATPAIADGLMLLRTYQQLIAVKSEGT